MAEEVRDALNHGLRDIPPEKIRLHVCWGSFHGPHHDDIPLRDIIDLIFRVRAAQPRSCGDALSLRPTGEVTRCGVCL